MEEKNIFQQKLDLFLQEYLAETIHTIRQQNPICKELVKAKAMIAQQLQNDIAFWSYEELETQYIIVLTEAIYKQAMKDFYFFVTYYLKK